MKWLLVTWYITGGYPWTNYEFDSKKTCEAAAQAMRKNSEEGMSQNYSWFCIEK